MWSRGLSEFELCKIIGLNLETWKKVSIGVRRPSHTLVNALMEILGDEVQLLFMKCYIENKIPSIISADKYKGDLAVKNMKEKLDDLKLRGKKRVYE